MRREGAAVLLEYYAHACFALSHGGTRIVFDPYGPEVGYKMPQRGAQLTLVSHEHFDHNHTAAIVGRTQVVRGAIERQEGPIAIRGLMAPHDQENGTCRGHVTVFCVEWEGVRVAHLSDLGCTLEADLLREIGPVDALLVPVGGGPTIDGDQAAQVVRALAPRFAIPMHYRTPFLNRTLFPDIAGVERFAQLTGARRTGGELKLEAGSSPTETLLMAHLF